MTMKVYWQDVPERRPELCMLALLKEIEQHRHPCFDTAKSIVNHGSVSSTISWPDTWEKYVREFGNHLTTKFYHYFKLVTINYKNTTDRYAHAA